MLEYTISTNIQFACDYVVSDIYWCSMSLQDKPLVWLHGEVKSPPFSSTARIETGFFLRRLQRGEQLTLPHSRPMPRIGARCHELRIVDTNETWRIIYRTDFDAIIIASVFSKKTTQTPRSIIDTAKKRLRDYDDA